MQRGTVGKGIALGAAAGLLVTVIGCGICALLISLESIALTQVDYVMIAIWLVASFFGAKMAIGKTNGKRLAAALITACVYLLTLLTMTGMFFGGQYRGVGYSAMVILSGAIAAAITGINRKKHDIFRKSKNKHR